MVRPSPLQRIACREKGREAQWTNEVNESTLQILPVLLGEAVAAHHEAHWHREDFAALGTDGCPKVDIEANWRSSKRDGVDNLCCFYVFDDHTSVFIVFFFVLRNGLDTCFYGPKLLTSVSVVSSLGRRSCMLFGELMSAFI